MSPVSRTWATPLAIGMFSLMGVTGVLMFFHAQNHLQEEVHSWAGWALVAAVALHAVANGPALLRHFRAGQGAWALVAAALLVGASFFVVPAGGAGAAPPAIAIEAITQAPIGQVAPLFGKTGEAARRQLAAAGIVLADDSATLAAALGGERERVGRALQVLAAR